MFAACPCDDRGCRPLSNMSVTIPDISYVSIICGPIVGHVTDTTARILLESRRATDVRLVATPDSGAETVSVEGRLPGKGVPHALELTGLQPNTAYTVSLEGVTPGVQPTAYVRTQSSLSEKRTTPARIAIVSCNKVYYDSTGHADLWDDLAKRAQNHEIDMVLHIGDQVYADSDYYYEDGNGKTVGFEDKANTETATKKRDTSKANSAFYTAVALLKDLPQTAWEERRDEILECYRKVYRATWNKQSTALALASVPNYMVLDDHEINDDWGDTPDHQQVWTIKTVENFVGACAWQVWNEYQRQLWEDIEERRIGAPRAHIFHRVRDIGVIVLDVRATKSFLRSTRETLIERPFLGDKQWGELEAVLSPSGDFSTVETLVVASPVPMAFMSPATTNFAKLGADDLAGIWTGDGIKELPIILDLLWKWKTAKPNREVVIAGGDVHVGIQTTVFRNGAPAFHQMTSSAIHNSSVGRLGIMAANVLTGDVFNNTIHLCHKQGGGHWSYHHNYITKRNNYGIISITPPSNNVASITCDLVEDVHDHHSKTLKKPLGLKHGLHHWVPTFTNWHHSLDGGTAEALIVYQSPFGSVNSPQALSSQKAGSCNCAIQ